MDINELLKKVIEFRDARDWEQMNQRSEDGGQSLRCWLLDPGYR
jgi:hypothetical protein